MSENKDLKEIATGTDTWQIQEVISKNTQEEGKKKGKVRKTLLGLSLLQIIGLLLVAWIASSFIVFLVNFITTLTGTFLPKQTATTLSFYSADSFYGIPVKVDENATPATEIGAVITEEDLQKEEKELGELFQKKLDSVFGQWTYKVRVASFDSFTEDGVEYPTLYNLSEGTEGIRGMAVYIKKGENGVEEGIYYYASLKDEASVWNRFSSLWGGANFTSAYKDAVDAKKNIYLLRNNTDSSSRYQAFQDFVNLIRGGKKNSGNDVSGENKPAFEELLKTTSKEDTLNVDVGAQVLTVPRSYLVRNSLYIGVNSYCKVSFSYTEKEDLNCEDGKAVIRLSDDLGNILSFMDILTKNKEKKFVIQNVKTTATEPVMLKLQGYVSLVQKYNQTKLHDSYLVDMLNFVGTNDGNSNQKVLSQEKVNLWYFAKKKVGKTHNSLLLDAGEVQKFTKTDAQTILDYNDGSSQDSYFTNHIEESNKEYEIYKVEWGFSSDGIRSKCSNLPIVYPNVDALVHGFEINETVGSGKGACVDKRKLPPLLKEGVVKYYKKFNFVDDLNENKSKSKGVINSVKDIFSKDKNNNSGEGVAVVNRKKDDYKLNFFYHYSSPDAITTNVKEGSAVYSVNNISEIAQEKKSLYWKGIYLNVKSYGLQVNDETGDIDIKRDSRDGTPLIENLPFQFEIGLLTRVDDKEKVLTKNRKGEIVLTERVREDVRAFKEFNQKFADNKQPLPLLAAAARKMTVKGTIVSYLVDWSSKKRFEAMYENYSKTYGEAYNSLLTLYKDLSILDTFDKGTWEKAILRGDGDTKLLRLIAPRYIQKVKDRYIDKFLDNKNIQKRFTTLLNDTYYTKTGSGYTFDEKAFFDKYYTLFSKLNTGKEENKDKIGNFICSEYKMAEYIAKNMGDYVFDKDSIQKRQLYAGLLAEADMYSQCVHNYSDQYLLDYNTQSNEEDIIKFQNETKENGGWDLTLEQEKKKDEILNKGYNLNKLDLNNSLHPIADRLSYDLNKDTNDLYYLYELLKHHRIEEVVIPPTEYKGDWVKELFTASNNIVYKKGMLFSEFVDRFFFNDGTDNNQRQIATLKALQKSLKSKVTSLDFEYENDSHMETFLKKLSPENKAFYLFEYKKYQTNPLKYKEEDSLIKNLEYKKSDSKFFNIKAGFNFSKDYYNAEEDLHEMYVNPNIYLYAYFKGIKQNSKTLTVQVQNENKLWFYPADSDKFTLDSDLMYAYSDNISRNILLDAHLKEYVSIVSQIYHHNINDNNTNHSINTPRFDQDMALLKWFGLNMANDITKYNIVHNYMQNIHFYQKLATRDYKIPYTGNNFNVNLRHLQKKIEGTEGQKSSWGGLEKSSIGLRYAITTSIVQQDIMLKIKQIEENLAAINANSSDVTEKKLVDKLRFKRDFLYKLWSKLGGYTSQDNRQGLPLDMKLRELISDIVKETKQEDRLDVISDINEITTDTFGFGFQTDSSFLEFALSWGGNNVTIADKITPNPKDDKLLLSVYPKEIKENQYSQVLFGDKHNKPIPKGLTEDFNTFVVTGIGHPFNRNAYYSNSTYQKSYIDHKKIREVFEPMLSYTGTTNADTSNQSDKVVVSPSGWWDAAAEAEILGKKVVTSDQLTDEEIDKNNEKEGYSDNNTSSGSSTGSGTTGTWNTTSSGSVTGSGETIGGVNLSTGGKVGGFVAKTNELKLKNYSQYINGSVQTSTVAPSANQVFHTHDIEQVLKDIARLELFYGKNEITMTQRNTSLSQAPGQDIDYDDNGNPLPAGQSNTWTNSGSVVPNTTVPNNNTGINSGSIIPNTTIPNNIIPSNTSSTVATTPNNTPSNGVINSTWTWVVNTGSGTVDNNSSSTGSRETNTGTGSTENPAWGYGVFGTQTLEQTVNNIFAPQTQPVVEVKNANVQIEVLLGIKQCMSFLEVRDPRLYTALFEFQLKKDESFTASGSHNTRENMLNYRKPSKELYGLSFDERLKIFTFLVDQKNILDCGFDVTAENYKIYLDYIKLNIDKLVDDMVKYDSIGVKSYKLYDGVTYLQLPNTFTFSKKDAGFVLGDVKDIPLFKMQQYTFTNLTSKARETLGKKATYKFAQTSNEVSNLKDGFNRPKWFGRYSGENETDDGVKQDEMYHLYGLNILSLMLTDTTVLYDGLMDLTKEFNNYTLQTDIHKLNTFSSLPNMGPFYYLYTNNDYIDPENGLTFEVIDITNNAANGLYGDFNSLDPNLMMMDPTMFASYGEKVGVNAYLDVVAQKLCSAKAGEAQIRCNEYIKFLKGMDMASYQQEIEYLTYLTAAKKFTGRNPILPKESISGVGPLGVFNNKIKSKFPDYFNAHLSVYVDSDKNPRSSPWVGQCTWFAQLFKDTKWASGNGIDVANNVAGKYKNVTVDKFSPRDPVNAMKVIRPWDLISFDWWVSRGKCSINSTGHVGIVVATNVEKQTVTIAEGNAPMYFKSYVSEKPIQKLCPGTVAHWVNARYGKSPIPFGKGGNLLDQFNEGWNTSSGTTNTPTVPNTSSGSVTQNPTTPKP